MFFDLLDSEPNMSILEADFQNPMRFLCYVQATGWSSSRSLRLDLNSRIDRKTQALSFPLLRSDKHRAIPFEYYFGMRNWIINLNLKNIIS